MALSGSVKGEELGHSTNAITASENHNPKKQTLNFVDKKSISKRVKIKFSYVLDKVRGRGCTFKLIVGILVLHYWNEIKAKYLKLKQKMKLN